MVVLVILIGLGWSYFRSWSRWLDYKDEKMRSKLKLWQGPPPIEKSDKSGEDS